MHVRFLGSSGGEGVCVCVCEVNSQEEREKRACSEFPQGPRLGQGKTSGALEVRRDEKKDGGEEGADEKVSKNGAKRKTRGVMGISEEGCMMLPVASVFALIHLSVILYSDMDSHLQANTHNKTRHPTCMHAHIQTRINSTLI